MPTKATTVEATEATTNGNVHNQREIVWPFDRHGFTTLLRKEGVRAIGRIKGNPEKLEVLIETLKVLGAHARTKVEIQIADSDRAAIAADNRAKAEFARSLADQKAEVARLKRLLASAEAAVAAKEAMPGEEA